jgi:hypothetical protein
MSDLPDVLVPARFCGPPSSGNGGWSAGAIAVRAAEACPEEHSLPRPAVTVSLQAPPPLDVPLSVTTTDDGGVVATYDGQRVLSARCSHDAITDVEPVRPDEARVAMSSFVGLAGHPFPTCFACGTGRAEGDGLRIFPGRVTDATDGPGEEPRPRVAATWTPDPGLAGDDPGPDGQPRATVPVTWAALDCVGGWAGDLEERLMVLARMTARLDSLPVVGEEHVVVGMGRGREGRKAWTSSTLYDADGRVVGSAEHLWIAVEPADFA